MTDTINDMTNPDLLMPVEKTSEIKTWLVNYVGEKLNPKDDEVNVEMIIEVMSTEFPELLLAIAEENFIRGYRQAMLDVDSFDPTKEFKLETGK